MTSLHDATLIDLTMEWATGTLVLRVVPVGGGHPVEIQALGVDLLQVPRQQPWGPSVSVNEVRLADGRLEVEMQSGDEIVVEATSVELP